MLFVDRGPTERVTSFLNQAGNGTDQMMDLLQQPDMVSSMSVHVLSPDETAVAELVPKIIDTGLLQHRPS